MAWDPCRVRQRKAEARAGVAIRRKALQSVSNGSGGRYELYSNYALMIQAVAASITAIERPAADRARGLL